MKAAYQRATLKWLAGDDVGVSSRTMAFWLAFGIVPERHDYPYDIADLGTCMRLLRAVPILRARLHRMSGLDPVWARLVGNWRRLERLFWKEQPTGKCPRTWGLLIHCRQQAELDTAPIAGAATTGAKESDRCMSLPT